MKWLDNLLKDPFFIFSTQLTMFYFFVAAKDDISPYFFVVLNVIIVLNAIVEAKEHSDYNFLIPMLAITGLVPNFYNFINTDADLLYSFFAVGLMWFSIYKKRQLSKKVIVKDF